VLTLSNNKRFANHWQFLVCQCLNCTNELHCSAYTVCTPKGLYIRIGCTDIFYGKIVLGYKSCKCIRCKVVEFSFL